MKKTTKLLTLVLTLALAVVCAAGLSACNRGGNEYDDVLIVGSTMKINTLNRLDADGGQPGYYYDILAASLTQLTPVYCSNGAYYPQLCTYSTSSDGLVWTFDVKEGFTWHDGTAVTCEDLKYTFEKAFAQGSDYASIAVRDGKVAITLVTANPNYLSKLTTLRIYPKHIFEGKTKDTITDAESVTGCGPFKFSERNIENNTITFVKYDAYPDADKIAFEKVILKFFGTEDVMHAALKTGDIDMEYNYASGISSDAEADFLNKSNVKLQSYASKKMPKILFFNNARLTNANVKKAIQKAINYENIRRSFGTSMSAASREGFVSPAVFGYSETAELTRDLNGAKALLQNEGYGESNKFEFELLVRSDANDSQYASLIKTDLEETGMINVTLVSKALSDWQAYYQAGSHTACLGTVTAAGFDMQAGLATKYFLARDTSVLAKNPVCYANYATEDPNGQLTEFGKIYGALASATNDKDYRAAAKDFQDFIVKNTSAISLFTDSVVQAYSSKLSGFTVDEAFGLFNVESFDTLRKAA